MSRGCGQVLKHGGGRRGCFDGRTSITTHSVSGGHSIGFGNWLHGSLGVHGRREQGQEAEGRF